MLQFDVTMQRLCGIRYHLECIMLYFQSNPSVKTSVEHCKKSGIMFRILLNVEQLLKVVPHRMFSCCIAHTLNRYWISELYMCNHDYTAGWLYIFSNLWVIQKGFVQLKWFNWNKRFFARFMLLVMSSMDMKL